MRGYYWSGLPVDSCCCLGVRAPQQEAHLLPVVCCLRRCGAIVCMQTSWAWRHSYKHLNYSDFTVAYNVSGGHNSVEGLLSRFCIFVASPTRHTYNRQCLHSHTRTCACVQPEHNPECACRVAHVYPKPDRHAFEAPRHVPAPTPLAHSCEACAGRCAMGL